MGKNPVTEEQMRPTDQPAVASKKPAKLFSRKKLKTGAGAFKKSKKITAGRIILLVLILLVLAGGGYGIYRLFFYEEPVEIVTGTTKKDSITTVIEGTATTQPVRFQNLTIPVTGTVKEVLVKQGDKVAVGDPLYTIDTSDLDKDIADMESSIAGYESQLATYNENLANLTVTAPFAGKLMDTTTALAGDTLNAGTRIASIVDDSKMKLALYFINAFKDSIKKGMDAEVSVPQYMTTLHGTVTGIDDVSYITAEGAVCFKVTVTVDNPGSLTKGLAATAALTSDGLVISPAEAGTLDYNQTKTISAKVGGTIASMNVQNYQLVSSGEVLVSLTNDSYANQITTLEKQIASAQLNLEELQEDLTDCAPTATVAGTVIFVRIEATDTVNAGTSAMAIYNTDTMEIEASISETENDYITEGMSVTITKSGASGTSFTGTVTQKSLEATASNGVAYFPTTITIESNGALSAGVYVTYTITAAQASDVVLAPIAALQMTTAGTCLFIEADARPDNAVDLDDGVVPDGYYAIPVETGLTSNDYVEIMSGVDADVTVFERYVQKNTTAGSDQTSETSDEFVMPSGFPAGGNFSGGPGGGSGGFSGGPMGG
jgi:multidrug efflux pump subunit AcrA (membrane-fusion protein)